MRELRWWSVAKNAQDTAVKNLPPADVAPNGPTNLEPAIQQIIGSLPQSPPIELLILTDAEAEFADATTLSATLKDHHIRVHALLVGAPASESPLRRVVESTGGQFVAEPDAQKWTADVRRMLRASMPDQIIREPTALSGDDILKSTPPRTLPAMNRAWLKQSATEIAQGLRGSEKLAAAAKWTAGAGDVVALAFTPTDQEISAVEQAIARRPRDARFNIEWHCGATLQIRIDATDRGDFMNDLQLTLEMNPGTRQPIPQTAPGGTRLNWPRRVRRRRRISFATERFSIASPSPGDMRASLMRWGPTSPRCATSSTAVVATSSSRAARAHRHPRYALRDITRDAVCDSRISFNDRRADHLANRMMNHR